jgi:dolichyl-phosphooligosaccharide-protein glycotransferase
MKSGEKWYNSAWLIAGFVVIFFGIALYLRIYLAYGSVFAGDWIKYTANDAYYFMRQVDNVVHNFPHFLAFDPYQNFPTGTVVGGQNFFVYFVSFITWVIGLGNPSQHTVNVVTAYLPAVMGALTVVPVYFIGKALFNRWVGVFAAALIAIVPGEYLGRTILGNTDRDGFEVLLSALTMLVLILAVKSASQKQFAFKNLLQQGLSVYIRPLIYSVVLGILIGLYALTWRGSFLFILVILAYFLVQSLIDHFRNKSTEYLGFIGVIAFLIALIIFTIGSRNTLFVAGLVVSILSVIVITGLTMFLSAKKAKPYLYPVCIVVLSLIGLGIFYAASPNLFRSLFNQFSVFFPSQSFLTVSQMQPILFPSGNFSLIPVWGNYTTGIFLIFISLGILIYLAVRRHEPDKVLFIVWSIIILAATLLTRRIALFFALNVALLVGFLGQQIIAFIIEKTAAPVKQMVSVTITAKKKKTRREQPVHIKRGFLERNRPAVLAVTIIAVFFLTIFPDINPAISLADDIPNFVPSDNWYTALDWLRENTPEPLGDPDTYYKYYGQPFAYPSSAYGVAAWWDFGYWIMRVGHRFPISDPGYGAREQVAKLFTTSDASVANGIMDQTQTKYIMIDDTTIGSKMGGVTTYAGLSLSQFMEVYYTVSGSLYKPVLYFHPAYYQSMAVRLYSFAGAEVNPANTLVISWQAKTDQSGRQFKAVVTSNSFSTYNEAKAFIDQQKTGNYEIIGTASNQSPVPLPSLPNYKAVYDTGGQDAKAVRIFEYIK